MKGSIQEPVVAGALRIARLVVVIGVGLRLWQYNALLVDTFMDAPVALAARLAGAANPIGTIDAMWQQGGIVADALWQKGGVFNGDFGFYLAAAVVYALMGAVCVYTLFLMALARVALAVLLAVGPIFVVLLLFESTQKFFEAWIAQLANYALVAVLAVLTTALMLTVVESYAAQTAAKGAAILTVDALDMLLVAGVVLLILKQVMPIAARLSGGLALSSFGVASAVLGRGTNAMQRGGLVAGRGLAGQLAWRIEAMRSASRSSVSTLTPVSGPGIGRVAPVWRAVRGA